MRWRLKPYEAMPGSAGGLAALPLVRQVRIIRPPEAARSFECSARCCALVGVSPLQCSALLFAFAATVCGAASAKPSGSTTCLAGVSPGAELVGVIPGTDVTRLDPDDDIGIAEGLHVRGGFFRAFITRHDAQRGLGHARLDMRNPPTAPRALGRPTVIISVCCAGP